MYLPAFLALVFLLVPGTGNPNDEPFWKWPLSKAVEMLNSSAWARQETFTRIVGGVGSGVSGEKEIYNTFYVRFLSARPVREAYARIQQIQHGYDKWTEAQKREFDRAMQPSLDMDVGPWIVVAVTFRSNDPNEESSVRRFFQSETTETLKNRAFLSTERFPQVELHAYFPPRDDSVGAKFVFPREIDGAPLITPESGRITFELLEVPGAKPDLTSSFSVKAMVIDGELIV